MSQYLFTYEFIWLKLCIKQSYNLPSNNKVSINVLNNISPMCLFILITIVNNTRVSGVRLNSWGSSIKTDFKITNQRQYYIGVWWFWNTQMIARVLYGEFRDNE